MSAEIRAVRCKGCGGAVAAAPGRPLPACLFCGADALEAFDGGVEEPTRALPFDIDEAAARAAFQQFARSSWWYPSDLAGARVALRQVFVPAWAYSGRVQSTWAGLVSDNTRSGKRPVSGTDAADFAQVVVPASASLQPGEVRALGPWDEGRAVDFDREQAPFEVSTRTRDGLRQAAQEEFGARHASALSARHALLSIRAAHLAADLDGRPFLLPIWIGAYRYRDLPFRVVLNGQTGTLTGTAPRSRWKIFFAVAVPLVIASVIGFVLTGCAGLGALFGG